MSLNSVLYRHRKDKVCFRNATSSNDLCSIINPEKRRFVGIDFVPTLCCRTRPRRHSWTPETVACGVPDHVDINKFYRNRATNCVGSFRRSHQPPHDSGVCDIITSAHDRENNEERQTTISSPIMKEKQSLAQRRNLSNSSGPDDKCVKEFDFSLDMSEELFSIQLDCDKFLHVVDVGPEVQSPATTVAHISPQAGSMTAMSPSGLHLHDLFDLDEDLVDQIGEDFRSFARERTLSLSAIEPIQGNNRCDHSFVPFWNSWEKNGVDHGKSLLKSLKFDALSYSSETLVDICIEIFVELELDTKLGISRTALRLFVLNVRSRMLDNPYHNWFHVVDVLQTIYALAWKSGLIQIMGDKERFALCIAALCHDLEHPGLNNMFLVKARSTLASVYNMDGACLEKHHSFLAFTLMTNEEHSLLANFSEDDKAEVLWLVEGLIMATDMGRHADYMSALRTAVDDGCVLPAPGGGDDDSDAPAPGGSGDHDARHDAAGPPPARPSPAQRRLMAEALLKCADTSNVVKPFPVARRWAVRITDEFFQQGDLERSRGMKVTPMCDRRAQSRVGLQRGFIDFVAAPFCRALAALLPGLGAPLMDALAANRAEWDRYPSDEALLAEVEGEGRRRLGGASAACQ